MMGAPSGRLARPGAWHTVGAHAPYKVLNDTRPPLVAARPRPGVSGRTGAVGRLVHHALGGVVAAHRLRPACPVAALLGQLTLGGVLDWLARSDPAGRHLPGMAAGHVAILAHQHHGVGVQERQHPTHDPVPTTP